MRRRIRWVMLNDRLELNILRRKRLGMRSLIPVQIWIDRASYRQAR